MWIVGLLGNCLIQFILKLYIILCVIRNMCDANANCAIRKRPDTQKQMTGSDDAVTWFSQLMLTLTSRTVLLQQRRI